MGEAEGAPDFGLSQLAREQQFVESSCLKLEFPGLLDGFFVVHVGAVLGQAEMNGQHQIALLARLGEIAKDAPVVDRLSRLVDIFMAGEQHTHGIWRNLPYLGEKLGAVHAGHAHV